MADVDYKSHKKDELIDLLKEKDNQLAELERYFDDAMNRLSLSESQPARNGVPHTHIDAGEDGTYVFCAHGINIDGRVYTPGELKSNPQIVVRLYKMGSDLVKKQK